MSASRVGIALAVVIALPAAACGSSPPRTNDRLRAWTETNELFAALGYDPRTERFSVPFTQSSRERIVDALIRSERTPALRLRAVLVTIAAMRQRHFTSADLRDHVIGALERLRVDIPDFDQGVGDAIWYAELLLRDPGDRIAPLAVAVNGSNPGSQRLAIEELVNIGSDRAIEILQRASARKSNGGLAETARRLELGVYAIRLTNRMRPMAAPERVEQLEAELASRVEVRKGWGEFELTLWLLSQVERTSGDLAHAVLRGVWTNVSALDEFRYIAQEALVRHRVISSADRTISYVE